MNRSFLKRIEKNDDDDVYVRKKHESKMNDKINLFKTTKIENNIVQNKITRENISNITICVSDDSHELLYLFRMCDLLTINKHEMKKTII